MNLFEVFRRRTGLTLSGISSLTAHKGASVYGSGRVLSLEETSASQIEGEVEGSRREVYQTLVTQKRGANEIRMSSRCSCPVAVDCKHGAALLMAWILDNRDIRTEPVKPVKPESPALEFSVSWPGLPPVTTAHHAARALALRQQALQWVRQLQSVRLPVSSGAAPDRPRLYYVLTTQERIARLQVFRIRQLKSGDLSQPESYGALREHAHAPPGFWDETDAMVALALVREDSFSGLALSLVGPRAREALLALAGAGRLFLDKPPRHVDDPFLRPGPMLAGRVVWLPDSKRVDAEAGEPSTQRLGLDVAAPATPVYTAEPCYVDRESGVIGPLGAGAGLPLSLMNWLREAPPIPADAEADVAMALETQYQARPPLRARIPGLPGRKVRELKQAPRLVLGLFTTGSTPPRYRHGPKPAAKRHLAVSMAVDYAGHRSEPLRVATLGIQTDEGPVLLVCDPEAERAALQHLRKAVGTIATGASGFNLAPERSGASKSSGWLTVATLSADSVAAARIKHDLVPELRRQNWEIVDHAELTTTVLAADELVVALRERGDAGDAGKVDDRDKDDFDDYDAYDDDGDELHAEPVGDDWFVLQSGMQVGERRIDLAPVLAQIVAMGGFDTWVRSVCPQGVLWLKLSDSEVLRLEASRIEPLARVVAAWAEEREQRDGERSLLLSPLAAAQLSAAVTEITAPPSIRKLRELFESFGGLQKVPPPSSFQASLRPYQEDGLAWLQFIAQAGLGAVLADDMGLGKTIQVLAHLECERAAGRLVRPALVVAPTSVIFNWQAEAARHAPGLRVLALTGPDRAKRSAEIPAHDMVLTSYALLPRDIGILKAQPWHAVIVDEAQMVKNPRTLAALVLRSLTAGHRIALTGTPLENHLGELWSIMDFVLPGLVGREVVFRNRFRTPIERRSGTELAAERLQALERRIRPFLLRRTKAAVLADLPPRTEIIERVELPTEQRDLYESIRAAMDKRVREALARSGLAKSHIVMLDALLKLRQACCDPALVKLPGARKVKRSAKRDALIELLATLVDENRKALVFSQFTGMLDLIETAIDADPRLAAVPRSRLDGGTADRGAAVERFQQGDAQLFLLSLKAGGVGLNLTAADTVIHYDPWWNPAVENQATDRAHRIGQDKPVFVHKLIAAGTVEERILALQARKADLVAAVLTGSLTAGGTALSQEDLLGLFEAI